MRSVQRGISALFLVVAILTIAVALTAGYFSFYIDAKKAGKLSLNEINSFEDCAKLYPVMESYPEQCSTPDGKHFTRELTDEEKQQLAPQTPQRTDETADWRIYINKAFNYQIKYPNDWTVSDSDPENISFIDKVEPGNSVPGIIAIHVLEAANFKPEDISSYSPFGYKVIEEDNKVFLVVASTYQDGVASSDISEKTRQKTIDTMEKMLQTFNHSE